MKFYLVGGFVRDLYLGNTPNDRDFVVVGATPEEMVTLGYTQVGLDFPVFLHPKSGDEYALARIERKVGVGHTGFTTEFQPTVSLEQDLYRRDFTMNAMAIPVDSLDADGTPHYTYSNETIIDPFGGKQDLDNKTIRHVSEAFAEDPLRILRACRFAARYKFQVHTTTWGLMVRMVHRGDLDHLEMYRVWKELSSALMTNHPDNFFYELEHCGALHAVFPELLGGSVDITKGGYIFSDMSGCDYTLAVRFTMIATKFGTDLATYKRYKVPNVCSQLAIVYNKHGHQVVEYPDYTAAEKVKFLTQIGGLGKFRKTTMFSDFIEVYTEHCASHLPYMYFDAMRAAMADRNMLLAADVSKVVEKFAGSKNMGQHIADHYINLLESKSHVD